MPGVATGFPFGTRGALLPSRPSYTASTKTASGRAPAGAVVTVRINGSAAATVSADAQGRWSHVFATAPSNGQTITASAEVVSPGLRVAVVLPAEPLGPTTAAFAAGASAGTLIAAITGLASDETIASFTPDDGRLALDSGRRTLLAGLSAAAAGTIAAALTTSAGRSLAMTITVNAVSSEPPVPVYGLVTATKDGSTGQTYTLNAPWSDVQWYRMALASPFGLTAIAGATGSSYVAQAADQGSRLVAAGMDAGTRKAAKALHVVYEPPVVIEPFESLSGFTASNGAQLALVSDAPAYGASRLRVVSSGQNLASASKSLGSFDPSLLGTIAFQGDLGMDEARQSGSARVVLKRASVEQVSGALTTTGTNYETPSPVHIGRRWGAYHVSEIPGLARSGANAMSVVVGSTGSIPWSAETKFDALLGKAGGRATVILGFDDNILTQYQNAFPAMEARGMKGIFYLPSQSPQNSSYMSLAMLKEMYAAGWDCGLDSTHDDSISSSFGTMAAWEASFQQNRDYALANGMTRGNEHICYTHGQIETNPPSNRVMVSAVTSDGSNLVTLGGTSTGYPSGTTVAVGMRAVGDGVPNSPATTVVEVVSATQVRLSAAVPAQTKAMLFVDTSPEFYTMKLPRRVAALGVRTARTTKNQGGYLTRFGFGDTGMFTIANALHNTPLATFKVLVDRAILCGLTIEFYTHGVQNGAPNGSSELSEFIAKLDYLKEKMDLGLLDVLPWSQVWQRDGNAGVPANLQSPPAGAPSAISFVGATANNNVPSIPSGQQAGDLLLAFAYRDGSTTPPTLPAGWTEITNTGANSQSLLLAWKFSAGASETAPTFTGATNTVLHCYRGMSATSPIGSVSPVATAASGTVSVPASGWSLQKGDNTSWVAYFGGSRAATSSVDTDANRIGHTNANSTSDAGGSDTLGPISAPDTFQLGGSGGQFWYAVAVEIRA